MKPFRGTAEMHFLSHLRLREKLFIAGVLLWAYCIPGCAHAPPEPVAHDAAGCVQACPGAAAVQTSETGAMCRCWAPNAFAYTFGFPDSAEKLAYARSRWSSGFRAVEACQRQGLGWETDEERNAIQCVQPEPVNPLKRTFLRLRWDGAMWPRLVPRPAWTLWRTESRRA